MKKLCAIVCGLVIALCLCGQAFAATTWYIVPYNRRDIGGRPGRYCAMDDYTANITADGGKWSETEILGDYALVKVNASSSTLTTLAGVFYRLPRDVLSGNISNLSSAKRTALKNKITALGYTTEELQARFGSNFTNTTLRDVLNFVAQKRLKPRYDAQNDTIVIDGAVQPVRPVDDVDKAVK